MKAEDSLKGQSRHPQYRQSMIHREAEVERIVEDDRTGMSAETIERAFADNLYYIQGVNERFATLHDYYMALAYTVRDRLIHRWIKTRTEQIAAKSKTVFYLSAEFLMGRQLGNNLLNIGCWKETCKALGQSGLNLYDLMEQESDPGLGNGGLGRLAACFLDSLATLDVPAIGYGIRYEFGIFEQAIDNGWQIERPDKWLALGNPWEIARPQHSVEVGFGGHVEYKRGNGSLKVEWHPEKTILGTPYDTMVPGFNTDNVNTLRLWSAGASKDFDFQVFNAGDYTRAVEEKTFSENISKVLYPNDNTLQGKELRLRQQYFFVACSLRDIIRLHLINDRGLENLYESAAVQLNDTHPAVAVAELMRLLLDEHSLSWDLAWDVTVKTLGYTNHTLLSEALERWPVSLFGRVLPRHLDIIFEINRRFLEQVAERFPGDAHRAERMSLIEEGADKQIRMAHLATVGSHSVNGVAALHTELVKSDLLRDFYEMWPEKFNNKTNGITPRRWLMLCNPKLTYLITERIGKRWIKNLDELKKLEQYADDEGFQEIWQIFKGQNKDDLAGYIERQHGVTLNPDSIFDVQVKRLHEYKRQLLNVLHIVALYHRLKDNPKLEIVPRTFIFGAKAAPGYHMAKLIIKLINSVGDVVNNDPAVRDQLKVVFLSNFSVSLGEDVYPAADLSEQISLAGKEASGTGNMKFALNGALTIGTLDGANIEIRDAVGAENFFLFGMDVKEVKRLRQRGYYPREYYDNNHELRRVIDSIGSGEFSSGDRNLFQPVVSSLLDRDDYMLLADYQSYIDCQARVSEAYRRTADWARMSILNVARMGRFSSDRTISQYCEDVWGVKPHKIELEEYAQERAGIRLD